MKLVAGSRYEELLDAGVLVSRREVEARYTAQFNPLRMSPGRPPRPALFLDRIEVRFADLHLATLSL